MSSFTVKLIDIFEAEIYNATSIEQKEYSLRMLNALYIDHFKLSDWSHETRLCISRIKRMEYLINLERLQKQLEGVENEISLCREKILEAQNRKSEL